MKFSQTQTLFPTVLKRFSLVAMALLATAAVSCASENVPTEVPTMTPADILARADANTENLTAMEFNGTVRVVTNKDPDGTGEPTVENGLVNISGTVSGEWEAPSNWVASLEGFGFGDGILNLVTVASNGDRTLLREDPDDPWVEVAEPLILIPEPDSWRSVLKLSSLELRSDELLVNREPVYTFSGSREVTTDSLERDLLGSMAPENGTVLIEAFDVHVSKNDFDVRKVSMFIQTDEFLQERTWNFEEHNEDIEFELPEELVTN